MNFRRQIKLLTFLAAVAFCYFSIGCISVFASDFPDVLQDHKNYAAITHLVEKGVVAGYEDGYFRPERKITRTEFCALMARTLGYVKGEYKPIELPFSDVPEDYWGVEFISYCYELKLINGMGNNEFWPKDNVTLAQTAKMAVCAVGKEEEALEIQGEKWYDGYVEIANELGFFDLVDGSLNDAAIRSDIAQIVFNMSQAETDDKADEKVETGTKIEEEENSIPKEIIEAYNAKDFSDVKTILIDAGHNYRGKDIGAENKELSLREEEITWQIADKLRHKLEYLGYTVVMTRNDVTDSIGNTSVVDSLQARVDLGHQSLADMFISIHCNAGGGSGTEVYCFRKYGYAGRLANLVQNNITDNTVLYDRGVKTANYYVIQNTLMPAILIETGFIDSKFDVDIISYDDGQENIAEAIADAVVMYDNMPPIKKQVLVIEEGIENEDN
jgi:N-acetylmuramoyl-L-alanine amidase